MVDYQQWTGRDLVAVLNLDARTNPRDWPTRIENPAAFLRHRLSRIANRLAEPSPSQVEAERHQTELEQQRARAEQDRLAAQQRASITHVKNTMADLRRQLARRRSERDASASLTGK